MSFIKFFLNLIIFFLSLINVWKSRKLNLRKANYFIIKNNKDLIDTRSVRFINLNKKDLSKSLNFVRCVSLSLSFKSLFYLKNIVVIDSLYNFILQKNKILEKKSVNTNKEYSRIITQIIKYSKINEFKMIDDYRLMSLFLPILNKLKIFSIGYMHGRISKDLEYQKNLQLFKFDKYYVWNEYFKEKILRINKKYQKKESFIKNPLCFIEEDNIKLGTYRKIISELKKQKKFKIYFKFRPNNRPNHALLSLLKKNNIQYFFKENVYKLFTQYNIKILFAFNSSLLVECSYYNVIPIMIYSNKIFLQEYIKDGIVFSYRLNNIKNIFNQQVQITKKFKTMKKSIWKYD